MSIHLGGRGPGHIARVQGVDNPLSLFRAGEQGAAWLIGNIGSAPSSWRVNLIKWSEDTTDPVWTKTDSTPTENAATGVSGTASMDLITEGTAGTATLQTSTATITANGTATYAADFARGNTDWIRVLIFDTTNASNRVSAWFNLATGAKGVVANGGTATGGSSDIEDLGDGIYRCKLSGAINNSTTTIGAQSASASANSVTTRVNNATYYIDRAQLEENGSASAYQKITDAVTEAAPYFPGVSLFQDANLTTPATAAGQEILCQVDSTGNGNHRIASAGTGPVLQQRTDGVYYLDYAGGKTFPVPNSTALFKYLHDGTGGSVAAFIEWPQGTGASNYVTSCSSTAHVGFQILKSATTQGVNYSVNRGVSGNVAATLTASRAFVSSPARLLRFSYKNDGGATDGTATLDNGTTKETVATSLAPSSSSSNANLQVTTTFGGKEYGAIAIARTLTDAEVWGLYRYFRTNHDYPVPSVDLTLLLGGQSNMSGRGTVATTLAEDKQVGVYSYTRAEEFRIATVPEHSIINRPIATSPDESSNTAPQHGFALRAAKSLNTNSAVDVLLVPCAIGGTSIAQWDTPGTIGDRTTLFGAMAHRYSQAAAKGGDPVIVWYGHEANATDAVADFTNGGVGTTYQTAFSQLIADIRSEIVDAPLVFVQLASDDTLADAEQQAAAGEAQRQLELSLSNAYMVVAHDVARNASTDDIHVSRTGMDTIADRVALAIREHVLGEPVNGTGPRIVSATYSGSTITLTCNKTLNTTAGNYGNLFRVYADGVEQTVSSANRGGNTSTVSIVCSAPLSGSITLTYGYRAGAASAARTDFVADSDGLPLPLFGPIVVTP